ncbi:DgyrCDS11330 [Dimorphilus gyrociliatus]|uniref:DgyrCDS11330 n=1 Tax=Dimorphilus gyrociliatus TaxID=2664684 RepID=A0A7I8W7R0_9ANNE|nr:DgyrCDS11330 [Dimorphilus gyrociliatus]
MSESKQRTLLQTWQKAPKQNSMVNAPKAKNEDTSVYILDSDDDDAFMAAVADTDDKKLLEMLKNNNEQQERFTTESKVHTTSSNACKSYTNIPDGFDLNSGRLWIYPTNYPVRDYQYNIVQQALFKNTLVALPTGLGKTFIAAVVMYNFYRWYPSGKIIFMAPTKPLVAQQIESCYRIMGIPQQDTAEMTGTMKPKDREFLWHSKRVFFLTPQVMANDLGTGIIPPENVKCIVVDEAHKATGNHAYHQVVDKLKQSEAIFRMLALSATPGSNIKAVQEVVHNLLISHIELRSDESIDIKRYLPKRQIDKIIVPLDEDIRKVKQQYLEILSNVGSRLKKSGAFFNMNAGNLSKFAIIKARESFRKKIPPGLSKQEIGMLEGDFALCTSLCHGLELLELHGLKSLKKFLESTISGDKGYSRTRTELLRSQNFLDILDFLKKKFSNETLPDLQSQAPPLTNSQLALPYDLGHPKLIRLQDVVLQHFNEFPDKDEKGWAKTRVMVFSQYRDSVEEITAMLSRHRPLITVMSFIGQSQGKTNKGITQKEQLKVMEKFRKGGYNTLVSTCVGEEGLDIGDVDLIVCFDASKSPIRLVQRIGRTGRKRAGRIVMLITEGKEEQIYNQSITNKDTIHKALSNSGKKLSLYQNDCRMVPEGLFPECHKMDLSQKDDYRKQPPKKSRKIDRPSSTTSKTELRKKRNKDDKCFLTESELDYWGLNFKLLNYQVILPKTRMISLGEDEFIPPSGQNVNYADPNKYYIWQSYEQEIHKFDHSKETKALVHCMQFLEKIGMTQGDNDAYEANLLPYLQKGDVVDRKSKILLNNNESPAKGKKRKSNSEIDIPIKRKCNWIIDDENEEVQDIENKMKESSFMKRRVSTTLIQAETSKRENLVKNYDNDADYPFMNYNRSNEVMDINQDNSINEISVSYSFSSEKLDCGKVPSLISYGLQYFENLTLEDVTQTVIRFKKSNNDKIPLQLNIFDDNIYKNALCDSIKYVKQPFNIHEKSNDEMKQIFQEISDTDEEIIKTQEKSFKDRIPGDNQSALRNYKDSTPRTEAPVVYDDEIRLETPKSPRKEIEQFNTSTHDLFASDNDDDYFEIENQFIDNMKSDGRILTMNHETDDLIFKPPAPIHSSTPFVKSSEAKKTPKSETPKFYTASQALRKLNFQDTNTSCKSGTEEISSTNELRKENQTLELSLDMDSLFDTDEIIEGSQLTENNDIGDKSDKQLTDKLYNNNIRHRTFKTPSKIENNDKFLTPQRPKIAIVAPITRKFKTSPISEKIPDHIQFNKNDIDNDDDEIGATQMAKNEIFRDLGGYISSQAIKSNMDENEEADESNIGMKRRNKLPISSQESPESAIKRGKMKRSRKLALLSSDESDDNSEGLTWLRCRKNRASEKTKVKYSKEEIKDYEPRKQQRTNGREFIADEADVSGPDSGESSDDGSALELLQESFIDNNDVDLPTATQHAAYLKDMRSPIGMGHQRYKLAYGMNSDMDVFSQIPQPDVTNYEENSFCVADDQEPTYEFSDDGSLENFIEQDKSSSDEDQLLSKRRPKRDRTKQKTALQEKFQTLKRSRKAHEDRKKYRLFSKPIREEEEDNEVDDDNDIIAIDDEDNTNCHRDKMPFENEQPCLELELSLDDFIESDSDVG